VSNGNPELEGKVGEHFDQSSDVQVIVSYYGASNLESILSQSTPKGRDFRIPALKLLLGDTPDKKPELAKLASPVAHLDKNDPPLLLIHGDADPQMPPEQSQELAKAYQALGLPVTLIMLPGSLHGGSEFYDEERTAIVAKFLDKVLR
jgi:dipeptidyl aminopeptidase/acylaminoacyl peptidase